MHSNQWKYSLLTDLHKHILVHFWKVCHVKAEPRKKIQLCDNKSSILDENTYI